MSSIKNDPGSVDKNLTLSNDLEDQIDSRKMGMRDGHALMEDNTVWQELKRGNDTALIILYDRYFNALIHYGFRFTSDPELIKDAIQDLFVDLRIKRFNLPPIRYSVKFFLLKSVKNKILQYLRKEQRYRKNLLESHEFDFDPELSIEHHLIFDQNTLEQKRKLAVAIEKLSSREKEALYYLFFQKIDYSQIKDLMELDNIKSARNLIYKAISKLKLAFKTLPVLAISLLLF